MFRLPFVIAYPALFVLEYASAASDVAFDARRDPDAISRRTVLS